MLTRNAAALFSASGSSNALRLLLNIEQYEIMRGPQIDAGVKVNNVLLSALYNIKS